jgi:hypothetical protein
MATRKPDPVKYSSPDGGQTKYIENQRVANDLKAKGVKAVAGKPSGDRSKRMAKNKQYAERKRGSTPKPRTTAGNTVQPVSRPQNVQGPLMQNGSYGNGPASPPPAQTFAQNGMNTPQRPMGQYGPMQGPAMPGGQFGMGQQSPMQGPPAQPQYNPSQIMSGYQPPVNPWGRRW